MKRLAIFIISVFFLFSTAVPSQAGKLHKEWKAAKKTASKALKKAKMKKLGAYVKFNQDLGPNLSKLEKIASRSSSNIKFKSIEKDKKLSKAFFAFCKSEYSEENWLFYTKGYKGKPKKIYDEYIKDGSKLQLNISSTIKSEYDKCNKSGKWKPCKGLARSARGEIEHLLSADTFARFVKYLGKNPEANPYNKDPGPLKEKVLAASSDYKKQIQKMDKKAAAAQKILLDSLKKIRAAVKKM